MNRNDFPMLKDGLIYFDNGATTLKPNCVIDGIVDYYRNYSANAHRGDYKISLEVDDNFTKSRLAIQKFIHAKKGKEIIFTSGTTDSLNKVIFGFFKHMLKKGDHVLLTKSEHASNVLPWFELQDELGLIIDYIELDENLHVTLENVKKAVCEKTKVISIAQITNVVGDIRPIKEITEYAHQNNIYVLVDGAQSAPHMKVDVQELDVDFFVFSLHKMCGPTGVGVIYGKEEHLNSMRPIIFGGGMNASFSSDGTRIYDDIPILFEAGTPNIAGVIASRYAVEYLETIGMERIHQYEKELKEYALTKLKEVKGLKIYNENTESAIIAFNMDGIFAQDLALYLDKYGICVRAGNHCAKILIDEIGIKNTCRMSLYFYNTKEEIDKLVEVLKRPNILEESLNFGD
ncbi:MAG: cysteine desulfurase [Firmicutes bacterium]|nr:cysteine desulfurase [Bacillota bacterium]